MPAKKNPLKLNKLQLRTLTLVQVLAKDLSTAERDPLSGDVTINQMPHAHGNHVHIGSFTVSAKDASGLNNPAVWTALTRKGLAKIGLGSAVTLTVQGLSYETGLSEQFVEPSDH